MTSHKQLSNNPDREKFCVSLKVNLKINIKVRMFFGVAQTIICAFVLFPVLEHFLSISDPDVNSLLFVTL